MWEVPTANRCRQGKVFCEEQRQRREKGDSQELLKRKPKLKCKRDSKQECLPKLKILPKKG